MRNNDYTATSIVYKVYQLLEIISVYSAIIMYTICLLYTSDAADE